MLKLPSYVAKSFVYRDHPNRQVAVRDFRGRRARFESLEHRWLLAIDSVPMVLNQLDNPSSSTGLDPRVFPAVGYIEGVDPRDGRTYAGTGTLIAPNVVLTAAHVIEDHGAFFQNVSFWPGGRNAQSIPAIAQLSNTDFGRQIAAQSLQTFFPDADQSASTDLALIYLSRRPSGIAPMPISSINPTPGPQMTFVGFGEREVPGFDAGDPNHRTYDGFEHYGITAPLYGGDTIGEPFGTVLVSNFVPGAGFTDHGDSGGPMILTRAVTLHTWLGAQTIFVPQVVGVVSRFTDPFVTVNGVAEPEYGAKGEDVQVDYLYSTIDAAVFSRTGQHLSNPGSVRYFIPTSGIDPGLHAYSDLLLKN